MSIGLIFKQNKANRQRRHTIINWHWPSCCRPAVLQLLSLIIVDKKLHAFIRD